LNRCFWACSKELLPGLVAQKTYHDKIDEYQHKQGSRSDGYPRARVVDKFGFKGVLVVVVHLFGLNHKNQNPVLQEA
jgi:hypothetical protein